MRDLDPNLLHTWAHPSPQPKLHLDRFSQFLQGSLMWQTKRPTDRPHYHTHTTTILLPFFLDHPGEPVPEENFWTLWCKGRLTKADTPSSWAPLHLDKSVPSSTIPHYLQLVSWSLTSLFSTNMAISETTIFYRPNALPAAQPTESKYWRQDYTTRLVTIDHIYVHSTGDAV